MEDKIREELKKVKEIEMPKGTFQIQINKSITEQQFIESCLNYKYSGYYSTFFLLIYALETRMNVDDFTYYFNLLEGVKRR